MSLWLLVKGVNVAEWRERLSRGLARYRAIWWPSHPPEYPAGGWLIKKFN